MHGQQNIKIRSQHSELYIDTKIARFLFK